MEKYYFGSGEIRTRASEETGALNQRLRPLGHATLLTTAVKSLYLFQTFMNDDKYVLLEVYFHL